VFADLIFAFFDLLFEILTNLPIWIINEIAGFANFYFQLLGLLQEINSLY